MIFWGDCFPRFLFRGLESRDCFQELACCTVGLFGGGFLGAMFLTLEIGFEIDFDQFGFFGKR